MMGEEKWINRINELADKLDGLDIPYKKRSVFGTCDQLWFDWCEADIVCHRYSYGHEGGLFEVMGEALMTEDELKCDSVAGHITMTSAINRIKSAYEKFREVKHGDNIPQARPE